MQYNTKIQGYLSIFADHFDVSQFNKEINIYPSKYWYIGDSIKGSKAIRKESCWEFSTPSIETIFFSDVSKIILSKFKNKVYIIKEYIEKNKVNVKLYVILEIWDDQTPSMHFDKEFIDFLHEINAVVNFDIYVSKNDK